MQWKGQRESSNVEDRRSLARTGLVVGGGGSILLVLVYLLLGGDPQALMNQGAGNQAGVNAPADPAQDEAAKFVGVVLGYTEDVWHEQFRRMGRTYREPKLRLFTGEVQSACGFANAAVGPFYCPEDEHVYLDLDFFRELKERFGAPGEFAQAYVVAHEVGHHVQKLLGTMDRVHSQRQQLSRAEYNRLSVRLELQADFLAGVWAHHIQKTKRILDPGDIDDALRAANAIGDDRLQKQSQGYVVPDSFTHGTSAQRIRWFRRGFTTGDLKQGDTFRVSDSEL